MKQIFLLIILTSGSVVQHSNAQRIYTGLSGGLVNSFKSSNADMGKRYSITENSIAAHIQYEYNPKLAIELQVQYQNEGNRHQFYYESTDIEKEPLKYDINYQHYYLRMPLNVFYAITNEKNKIKLQVYTGPSIGFAMKNDFSTRAYNTTTSEYLSRVEFINYAIKKLDFGWNLGSRGSIPIKERWKIFADIGYYKGFSNIHNSVFFPVDTKISNNHFSARMGVLLAVR